VVGFRGGVVGAAGGMWGAEAGVRLGWARVEGGLSHACVRVLGTGENGFIIVGDGDAVFRECGCAVMVAEYWNRNQWMGELGKDVAVDGCGGRFGKRSVHAWVA
jgi:hypothetical protein